MTTNKELNIDSFDVSNDQEITVRRCTQEDLDGVIEVNEKELTDDDPDFITTNYTLRFNQ